MAEENSNKRVAKNTLVLYCRMFITMAIGIWTSRIVLNALGFTDQGLYNLVGGFVGMLSIVSNSITYSVSRFLTYEIGRGDKERVNEAYRTANSVQAVLALVIIILAETLGLWGLNTKLVIPPDRLFATNVVYQLSVFNFAMNLMMSAQGAIIVAHEKMSIYAYVAIVTSVCNLLIAFLIAHSPIDRLILYAALQFCLPLATRIFYFFYLRRSFPWIRPGYSFSKEYFKPIFGFAGWNMIGATSGVLRNSGTGVLLNVFGGPIANTINGIANSANNLATLFVKDFTTAYNPQITKKYARGEYPELVIFLHRCSKFTFCLMAVMAIPVLVNVEPLLILWLKKIPEGTGIFAQLIILCSLAESVSQALITAKNATGNIRNYQIVVGGAYLLSLPLAYVFLKIGLPLYYAYIGVLISSLLAFIARMVMLKGSIQGWSSSVYFFKVIIPCVFLLLVGLASQVMLKLFMPEGIVSIVVQCVAGAALTALLVLYIVCNGSERQQIYAMVRKVFKR